MDEIISQREFARRLNVCEKTIRNSIKTGKVSRGSILVNGKPKINFPIAYAEAIESNIGQKSKIS